MSKKNKNISVKNLTIIAMLGFILAGLVVNITYLSSLHYEVHSLKVNQEIDHQLSLLRESSLKQELQTK